jgi:agmatinase
LKSVTEMIGETSLWAGLHRPGLPLEEADVAVLGVPFDGGVSFRAGAKDAPRELRSITYTIDPTTERLESIAGLKVLDLGDAEGPSREAVFAAAEEAACRVARAGKLLTVIGGDHSISIPIMRGLDRALAEPFAVVHLDSHFDLCDELGGDRLSHGATERRALELRNGPDLAGLWFIGIRSIESPELEFIKGKRVNVIRAADVRHGGVPEALRRIRDGLSCFHHVYLTVDIDCLDPAYAPGTGTPQFGGLDSRELLDLLEGLFDLPVIGFDVVEVAPSLDDSKIAVFAARKIITECWGHHWRKGKRSVLPARAGE